MINIITSTSEIYGLVVFESIVYMDCKREERRKMVMLGDLPDDFLRINATSSLPIINQPKISPSSQLQPGHNFFQPSAMGTLSITLIQAELVKNYGVIKMDPYVRVRIGHNVYETHADLKSGKHPSWNKTFHSFVPHGIKTVCLEVFDERSIIPDERIAWGYYNLPDEVFKGELVDTWISLSGRQGEGKEGKINVTFLFASSNVHPAECASAPIMVVPTPFYSGLPYYSSAQPVSVQYPVGYQPGFVQSQTFCQPQHPRPTEDEIKQMQDMFPSCDREVVVSVLESSNGNKDQAINALLSMSNES